MPFAGGMARERVRSFKQKRELERVPVFLFGARFFTFFAYVRSYCAPLARAERFVLWVYFLCR